MDLALERRKDAFSYETGEQSGIRTRDTALFECKGDGETIIREEGAWSVNETREKLTQWLLWSLERNSVGDGEVIREMVLRATRMPDNPNRQHIQSALLQSTHNR